MAREKNVSQHDAIAELAKDIQDRFKKWPQDYRRGVWDALTSKKGDKLIDRLVKNPNEPIINQFRTLSFKEWMEGTQKPASVYFFVSAHPTNEEAFKKYLKLIYAVNKSADHGDHATNQLVFQFRWDLEPETTKEELTAIYKAMYGGKMDMYTMANAPAKIIKMWKALASTAGKMIEGFKEGELDSFKAEAMLQNKIGHPEVIFSYAKDDGRPRGGDDWDNDGPDRPSPRGPGPQTGKMFTPQLIAASVMPKPLI